MNQFIRVTSISNGRIILLNTNSVEMVGYHDNGNTTIRLTNQEEIYVKESTQDIWDMLKPNIIFA